MSSQPNPPRRSAVGLVEVSESPGPGWTGEARPPHSVQLDLTGMTCASCANRIERKLNKVDGVQATVNFATEKASVQFDESVSVDDLIATVEKTGYEARVSRPPAAAADAESEPDGPAGVSLRTRLIVSATLTIPVVVMAMIPALQFPYWQWLSLALATPVVVWGAWPFHRAAVVNLRHGATTMDTLVSIGVWAAYLWSVYALVFGHAGMIGMRHEFTFVASRGDAAGAIYLEAASGITTLILLGRFLEDRAKHSAGAALRELMDAGAKEVSVLRKGREVRIPIEELAVGEDFVVRPGEQVATDGTVLEGSSAVDASALTGEPVPVDVTVGDQVTGGSLNSSGRLVVRATRVGNDTALAQLARLLEQAQSGKAAAQRLADRVSGVFVPVVILIALGTLIGWIVVDGNVAMAFSAAVAVLIIACPCALGLATPTALMVGTGRGAQLGILVKGPQALEATRSVDTVVLDKTGTVTSGRMRLVEVQAVPEHDDEEILRISAAVESASEHPIARAIVSGAEAGGHVVVTARDAAAVSGSGMVGRVEIDGADHEVVVGRPDLLVERGLTIPVVLDEWLTESRRQGRTGVLVGWAGRARGGLAVADTVKPTSAQAVSQFGELGLRVVLLTGDHEDAARAVAREVGIEEVIAGVLPAQKSAMVQGLQESGRVVAMIGDGINDAAALAQADLGIAMGTGTDLAIEASDLTIVGGDLALAPTSIRLARATVRTIKGNLFWAFAYNVAAIPVAAAGLLNPMLAGAAMAFSSVFVVTNSLRLRRFS
ncbi:MAG: heavy metal translocating P-type ATPase [Actinomycetales bacterium]